MRCNSRWQKDLIEENLNWYDRLLCTSVFSRQVNLVFVEDESPSLPARQRSFISNAKFPERFTGSGVWRKPWFHMEVGGPYFQSRCNPGFPKRNPCYPRPPQPSWSSVNPLEMSIPSQSDMIWCENTSGVDTSLGLIIGIWVYISLAMHSKAEVIEYEGSTWETGEVHQEFACLISIFQNLNIVTFTLNSM